MQFEFDAVLTLGALLQLVGLFVMGGAVLIKIGSFKRMVEQHGELMGQLTQRMTKQEDRMLQLTANTQRLIGLMEGHTQHFTSDISDD